MKKAPTSTFSLCRYATETNRLIVRLDKLLEGMPGDPAKRRDHETAIVTWIGTAIRKYHCQN